METQQLKHIVEAALLAAGKPLDLAQLRALFGEDHPPEKDELRAAIAALEEDYAERGIMVAEVASGFRIQARPSVSGWLRKLWDERPPRYSRALMETLAIIAYRQPVTRGDVESIRGVGVTTNIIRTLLERGWVRVVGYRDVPGKPAMYGTTREFLDYFGLRRLDDLPPLADLKDLESLNAQLELAGPDVAEGGQDGEAGHLLISAPEQELASAEVVLLEAPRDVDADFEAEAEADAEAGEAVSAGDEDAEGSSGALGNVVPLKAH